MKKEYIFSLILLLSVALYVGGGIYKEQLTFKNRQKEALIKEIKFENCINDAEEGYDIDWDGKCELEGKEEDCGLMSYQADVYNKRLDREKDRCIELYN